MVLEDSVFVHESLYETTSASDSFALGNINLQLGNIVISKGMEGGGGGYASFLSQ